MNLKPEERLIVAADFTPESCIAADSWIRSKVLTLAYSLRETGVIIKINSALRACGYNLIDEIHGYGLQVFADLKLIDIPNTLATDGILLRDKKPELLTIMCVAGIPSMRALKKELPGTEILGITVLTSLKADEVRKQYGCSTQDAVRRLAQLAQEANIGGLVSSAHEVEYLRDLLGQQFTLNTPAIRPEWASVTGDDQNINRVMTPARAIRAGADRIVIGRPITQADNPLDAVKRTIEEIKSAL